MKAYRIHSPRTLKLDETEALPVGDNCVKLKNLICGITPADVAVYEGRLDVKYPIIPVRQCVGFVSEVGSNVKGIQRGNRVVTSPQARKSTSLNSSHSSVYRMTSSVSTTE